MKHIINLFSCLICFYALTASAAILSHSSFSVGMGAGINKLLQSIDVATVAVEPQSQYMWASDAPKYHYKRPGSVFDVSLGYTFGPDSLGANGSGINIELQYATIDIAGNATSTAGAMPQNVLRADALSAFANFDIHIGFGEYHYNPSADDPMAAYFSFGVGIIKYPMISGEFGAIVDGAKASANVDAFSTMTYQGSSGISCGVRLKAGLERIVAGNTSFGLMAGYQASSPIDGIQLDLISVLVYRSGTPTTNDAVAMVKSVYIADRISTAFIEFRMVRFFSK